MRTILATLFLLMSLPALADQPGADPALTQSPDPALAKLVPADYAKRPFTVAVALGSPPDNFLNEKHEVVGWETDLARAAVESLGLELDLRPTTFDTLIPGLQSQRFDAAIGQMGITAVREKVIDQVGWLSGGRVGRCALARYRVPEALRESVLITAAPTNDDGLAVLPRLAEIAERIAPWVTVHIVPRLLRRDAPQEDYGRAAGSYDVLGRRYKGAGGLAFSAEGVVFLQSGSPIFMASTLCHEIFHVLWHCHLSQAAKDVLTAAVSGGERWPGDYYDSVSERTARMFENWCWIVSLDVV
jgi:hypothetical protein